MPTARVRASRALQAIFGMEDAHQLKFTDIFHAFLVSPNNSTHCSKCNQVLNSFEFALPFTNAHCCMWLGGEWYRR